MFTSNVTRCHRGLKQKLQAGYRALSRQVTRFLTFFLLHAFSVQACYAHIRSSGITLPQATLVPNFVCVVPQC